MTTELREPAPVAAPTTKGAALASEPFAAYRVGISGYTTYARPTLNDCWDLVDEWAERGVACVIEVVRHGSERWEVFAQTPGRRWDRDREGYPPEWAAEMFAPVTGFRDSLSEFGR